MDHGNTSRFGDRFLALEWPRWKSVCEVVDFWSTAFAQEERQAKPITAGSPTTDQMVQAAVTGRAARAAGGAREPEQCQHYPPHRAGLQWISTRWQIAAVVLALSLK